MRTTAARLRTKLRDYYDEALESPVVIMMPKGKYTPVFEWARAGNSPAFFDGSWSATVTYRSKYMASPESHPQVLKLEVDGDELFGTVTFKGKELPIRDGTVNAARLRFTTRWKEYWSESPTDTQVMARYRGRRNARRFALF